ncbi:MAG: hypothetical protein M3271_04145 [Actinomycetota bacterium]|nr:hypothetical protein [Actinomycetota bacterium]
MTDGIPTSIAAGLIEFFDGYVPSLDADNWYVDVDHTVSEGATTLNDEPLAATQEFVVVAPQFAIDPSAVVNRYPPASSTGKYGEVLPHVVLADPMLPWERRIADATPRPPWLALLVFADGELSGGDPRTHAIATTVGEFLKGGGNVMKPSVTREADVSDDDACTYVTVPADLFTAIAPRLTELAYLAHCRLVNTGDKSVAGLDERGLFSVVVANRFPATPPRGAAGSTQNVAHLVSLEGLEDVLVDAPDYKGCTDVAVVSLASWTFASQGDNAEDFRGLVQAMVDSETNDAGVRDPRAHSLCLRCEDTASKDAASSDVAGRLAAGFVPLEYDARSGERTFAWYRGPLTPVPVAPLDPPQTFLTADAASVYDASTGVFDLSLAAAWQIGRAAALADKLFGRQLMDFRRKAHRVTDALLHRLQSDHFSQAEIDSLDADTKVQDEFLALLDAQLLRAVGGTGATGATDSPAAGPEPGGDADPKAAVAAFLADASVQASVFEAVQDDLVPVAEWLGRLLLLKPLPFAYLAPSDRLLPVESLRFFYLDRNWLNALLDGAVSLGMESSRDTFFYETTRGLVHKAAYEAFVADRATLAGYDPDPSDANEPLSGLLLRSALVSGWPNLEVRAYSGAAAPQRLKTLRMDHVSPNVLLCVFCGVPDYVELSEPSEGLRFGVDEDGQAAARNLRPPAASGDLALGAQPIPPRYVPVFNASGAAQRCVRGAGSRVLRIDPAQPGGLVSSLQESLALDPPLAPSGAIGPAAVALQMVRSPEAVRFDGPGATARSA